MEGCISILFITAILSPFICRWKPNFLGWLMGLVPFILFLVFFGQLSLIMQGDTLQSHVAWLPAMGIDLNFYLDGLSLLFCLLITGMGTLVTVYSYQYLDKDAHIGRYYCYLFLFMGAMLGTVLSDNLIGLFIFWEMTSITSYLLISFYHKSLAARRAALQGLLVTGLGGFALLAGFILIISMTQKIDFTTLLTSPDVLRNNSLYTTITLLVLLGAFTKSAQFPFHFWLPNAMRAPTPISAFLHSATMVKLGVYLVARFTPLLGHTPLWTALLTGFGGATMIAGGVLALRATDLKQILAYSTIMALGSLMFLLASGSQETVQAAMIFLLAHALYKGGLFLCAGIIDRTAGTRELSQLGGLRKYLPITFIATILTAGSMAGLPPVLGFITKELVYEAKLAEPSFATLLIFIAVLTNIIFVTIGLVFVIKPFFGKNPRPEKSVLLHAAPFSLWFAPILLGLLGLFFGLYPSTIDNELIAPAVSAILQQSVEVEFSLWHGVTPALLLSTLTILSAIALFLLYPRINKFLKKLRWISAISPSRVYYLTLKSLNRFAGIVIGLTQTGYLRRYTFIVFATLLILVGSTFYFFKHLAPAQIIPHAPWFGWILALLLATSSLAVALNTRYFSSLAFLGVTGMSCTLLFLIYSAPDVAMTQLLVDVLTIVIVVLALYRLSSLPKYQRISTPIAIRNGIVALLVGLLVTTILLSIISVPFNLSINNFYTHYGFSLAHGRNIVNVILVDFRAFDTLGEMVVVGLAGFGVYTLLKFSRRKKEHSE